MDFEELCGKVLRLREVGNKIDPCQRSVFCTFDFWSGGSAQWCQSRGVVGGARFPPPSTDLTKAYGPNPRTTVTSQRNCVFLLLGWGRLLKVLKNMDVINLRRSHTLRLTSFTTKKLKILFAYLFHSGGVYSTENVSGTRFRKLSGIRLSRSRKFTLQYYK